MKQCHFSGGGEAFSRADGLVCLIIAIRVFAISCFVHDAPSALIGFLSSRLVKRETILWSIVSHGTQQPRYESAKETLRSQLAVSMNTRPDKASMKSFAYGGTTHDLASRDPQPMRDA